MDSRHGRNRTRLRPASQRHSLPDSQQSTNLSLLESTGPPLKLPAEAVTEFLALVNEYEPCPVRPGSLAAPHAGAPGRRESAADYREAAECVRFGRGDRVARAAGWAAVVRAAGSVRWIPQADVGVASRPQSPRSAIRESCAGEQSGPRWGYTTRRSLACNLHPPSTGRASGRHSFGQGARSDGRGL